MNKNLDIPTGMLKYAEPLIPIIGEDLVKKIFNGQWPMRDEGVKECEELVR
jgi:hypothetical protein